MSFNRAIIIKNKIKVIIILCNFYGATNDKFEIFLLNFFYFILFNMCEKYNLFILLRTKGIYYSYSQIYTRTLI